MGWFGLTAAQAGGLFAALAGLLVWLHIRTQPIRYEVPSLAPWRDLNAAQLPRRRISSRVALLSSLLVALCMVLALSDVRPLQAAPTRWVFLLDRSASMAARDTTPSRLELAKRHLQRLFERVPSGDPVYVLIVDDQVWPAPCHDAAALAAALRQIQPTNHEGDLRPALALSEALLTGAESARVVLLSDGQLRNAQLAKELQRKQRTILATHIVLGTQGANLAVTHAATRLLPSDPAHQHILVSLRNDHAATVEARLKVRAAGEALVDESLSLPKQEELTRVFSNVPSRHGWPLEIALQAPIRDSLPNDDHARVHAPTFKKPKVLVLSQGNRFLEAALGALDGFDITLSSQAVQNVSGFDLLIVDGLRLSGPPSLPTLYLGVLPNEPDAPQYAVRPYFDQWEEQHPVLRGLALRDVNIARALRHKLSPRERALASTESGVHLVIEGEQNHQPYLALTFDVRESDLPLRPAWPLLLLASMRELSRGLPEQERVSLAVASHEGRIRPQLLFQRQQAPATTSALLNFSLSQVSILLAAVFLAVDWLLRREP